MLADRPAAVKYITTAGEYGKLSKELLPILRQLKLSSNEGVRNAATKAVELIEGR
jgi:hypothetical protein